MAAGAAAALEAGAPVLEEPKLEAGRRVKLLALLARPDLNGTCGTVEDFNASSGRYNVRLEATGATLRAISASHAKRTSASMYG